MAVTAKPLSSADQAQTLKGAFNDHDFTLSVSSFLSAKVGRQVALSVASNVETYTFSESGTTLYVLTLTYTDSTRTTLSTAARTA
jgi:hypothetical protein